MKSSRAALAVVLFASAAAAQSATLISEGFDNVSGLVGWAQADTSTPASAPWFQGNTDIFTSQAGAAGAYIAVNPISTGNMPVTSASNYLMTPVFSLTSAATLSFYARSTGIDDGFPDRLQVLLSTAGSSTSVASFTSVLFDSSTIGNTWTLETVNIAAAAGTGRLAFRYYIPDATVAGDYLGIDTVNVSTVAAPVPEPSVVMTMLLGLGVVGAAARKRRAVRRGASL